jgi:hypothetical protein
MPFAGVLSRVPAGFRRESGQVRAGSKRDFMIFSEVANWWRAAATGVGVVTLEKTRPPAPSKIAK